MPLTRAASIIQPLVVAMVEGEIGRLRLDCAAQERLLQVLDVGGLDQRVLLGHLIVHERSDAGEDVAVGQVRRRRCCRVSSR